MKPIEAAAKAIAEADGNPGMEAPEGHNTYTWFAERAIRAAVQALSDEDLNYIFWSYEDGCDEELKTELIKRLTT